MIEQLETYLSKPDTRKTVLFILELESKAASFTDEERVQMIALIERFRPDPPPAGGSVLYTRRWMSCAEVLRRKGVMPRHIR